MHTRRPRHLGFVAALTTVALLVVIAALASMPTASNGAPVVVRTYTPATPIVTVYPTARCP